MMEKAERKWGEVDGEEDGEEVFGVEQSLQARRTRNLNQTHKIITSSDYMESPCAMNIIISNGNGDKSVDHNKNGEICTSEETNDQSALEEVEIKISDDGCLVNGGVKDTDPEKIDHNKNGGICSTDEEGNDQSTVVAAGGGEEEEEKLKISDNGFLVNGGGEKEADSELGIEEDATKSEKCIYYHSEQGLWKCRKCCWTYQSGSASSDEIQNAKQQVHMLMNFNTLNQGPCFTSETEGAGSTNGFSPYEHSSVEGYSQEKTSPDTLDVTIQSIHLGKSLSRESNLQYKKVLKHDNLNGSIHLASEITPVEDDTSFNSSSYEAVESTDINQIIESDLEVAELDVEKVLKEQNTHDLYCPNCNSCITRRVILRKRKRKPRTLGEEVKRTKSESQSVSISTGETRNPPRSTVDNVLDGQVPLEPACDDFDQEQQPDVFRCLSCLSFFIPTGNGSKLFQIFGGKRLKEKKKDSQQLPETKKGWFSSLFTSDEGTIIEQEIGGKANLEGDNIDVLIPVDLNKQNGIVSSVHATPSHAETYFNGEIVKTGKTGPMKGGKNVLPPPSQADPGQPEIDEVHISMDLNKQNNEGSLVHQAPSDATYGGKFVTHGIVKSKEGEIKLLCSSLQRPTEDGNLMVGIGEISDSAIYKNKGGASLEHSKDAYNQLDSSKYSKGMSEGDSQETLVSKPPIDDGEATENDKIMPQQDGLKFLLPSSFGSSSLENSKSDQAASVAVPKEMSDEQGMRLPLQTPVLSVKESYTDSKVNISPNMSLEKERDFTAALLTKPATKPVNVEVKINDKVSDTIIVVEDSQFEAVAAQRVQEINGLAETGESPHIETHIRLNEQRGTSDRGIQGVDIIKSIVYGGLVESITSLGVVSSAAGSEAATVTVLALGLANLIGGLIVIGHNLSELKDDPARETSNQQDDQVDRYQELLGRRKDFSLHAVIAILSFLFFGLLPPVIYGFSYRKSDDRDLKLVAVAAASLLGIIILAAGKAYVKKPPKPYIKTVAYYVVMGFLVSGISYAAGHLIMTFLEKLGFFQPNSVVNLLSKLPETGSMKPAWTSY